MVGFKSYIIKAKQANCPLDQSFSRSSTKEWASRGEGRETLALTVAWGMERVPGWQPAAGSL